VLFDQRKESPEVGQKFGKVEMVPVLEGREGAWLPFRRSGDIRYKPFLKRCDVLEEFEELRRKRMCCAQPFGAPDARVVFRPTGLCGGHLRRAEDSPTISLYHPGW